MSSGLLVANTAKLGFQQNVTALFFSVFAYEETYAIYRPFLTRINSAVAINTRIFTFTISSFFFTSQ
jgi:hypothetical protein